MQSDLCLLLKKWSVGGFVVKKTLLKMKHDVHGATAVEYGLVLSAIAICILTAVFTTGTNVKTILLTVSNAV